MIRLLNRPNSWLPVAHRSVCAYVEATPAICDVATVQVAGVAVAIGFVLVFSSFIIPWCATRLSIVYLLRSSGLRPSAELSWSVL